VFGGFAGGSWAGTGWDSSADDSFIMELSPYPRRWESSFTSHFIMKDVYGWPDWGVDELRFGQRGPLGLGDTTNPNAYDARCIAGTVYGTQANQPCGTTFGPTQMEVYYQCGEGSGNGPCPWDPPPPQPPSSACPAQAACIASLVDHGAGSNSLRYVGGDWASGSDESGDYITKGGTGNYVWFDYDLGSLDITITMTLKLSSLGDTSSMFTINSDSGGFNFDEHNQISIVNGALGATTVLGARMDAGVVDDALFDLRMQRVSSLWHLSIIVGGVTTFSYERASTEEVVRLGYRPHRSTIKIYQWDVQLDNSDCQAHGSEFQASTVVEDASRLFGTSSVLNISDTEQQNSFERTLLSWGLCGTWAP
jgi:hypothetical protein